MSHDTNPSTDSKALLNITGMHCQSCATKISTALKELSGVHDVEVSPQAGHATLTARSMPSKQELSEAIAGAGAYTLSGMRETTEEDTTRKPSAPSTSASDKDEPGESLYPLFLIVGFIAGVTILIAIRTSDWSWMPMMRHFMAGFFLVFSFFKLLDLPGFVSAYRGYDLIARRFAGWGWAYPFVELALGIAYLLALMPVVTNVITLVLMLIGAAGVLKALLDKRTIRCACLGTALNLPMTKVTLVEDLTMAAMAGAMLVLLLT